MDEKNKKANDIIMQEIGLEVGVASRIYDQDSGMALQINGYDVVAPGGLKGRQTVEFDPYNNRKMMNQLFGLFCQKLSDETDTEVLAYYEVPGSSDKGKGSVECTLNDNTVIRSGEYIRDSLKYADIIIQLNGGEPDSLHELDSPLNNPTINKKTTKGGTKNGRAAKV